MPRGMPNCCRQPLVSEPSYPVPFHTTSSSEQQQSRLLDAIFTQDGDGGGVSNSNTPQEPDLKRDIPLLCDAARFCRLVYRSPESTTLLWERALDQSHSPEEMSDPEVMEALRSVVSQPECVEAHDEFLDVCAYLFAYVPGAANGDGDGTGLGTIPETPSSSPSGKPQKPRAAGGAANPRLVVAFRGAASLEDALCGGGGAPQLPLRTGNLTKGGAFPAPKNATVHQGFLSQFKLLEPLLDRYVLSHLRANRRHRLLCCGHSLGGAVAAIAAVVYGTMFPGQVEWVSLGAPKIGNSAFAEALRSKASLRWRVKHGRDLVVKVPTGDFANCGQELHCGRDDPYPDIAVFQDLPDHDSIRYIEALDALAVKIGAEGDLSAFPLSIVGAMNPARGLAVVMNELFKAWLYWSGVGANMVGMQLPGSPGGRAGMNGARGVASSSDFVEPEMTHRARGSGPTGFRRFTGEPHSGALSGQSWAGGWGGDGAAGGGGGGGSFRGAPAGPPAPSGSRRAQSARFELPPQPPASRASHNSRPPSAGSNRRANSFTGQG